MYEGVRKDAAKNHEGRDHRQRTGIFGPPPCPDEIIRMAVQRFSPKRLGEGRCIALSSAPAEDFPTGRDDRKQQILSAAFFRSFWGKESGRALKVGMHPVEEGAHRDPNLQGGFEFGRRNSG